MTKQTNIQFMKLAAALRNAYDTVYLLKHVDGRFRYEYISAKSEGSEYLGEESVGKFMDEVLPMYVSQRVDSMFRKAIEDNEAVVYDEKINTNETERTVHVPIKLDNVEDVFLLVYSERIKRTNEGSFEIRTGLPSFNYFREFVQQKLEYQRKQDGNLALIYINIDKFNNIIDKIGHVRIESFLTDIANRLRLLLADRALLSRVTGDELIICTEDGQTVEKLSETLQSALENPFFVNRIEIPVTASIGISRMADAEETVDRLIMKAYRAMFEAKQHGGNQIKTFKESKSHQSGHLDKNMLQRELKKAIENQEFTIYYQPIIHLRTEVIHYEALIRWFSPKLGFISPDQFILVAEECGIIETIDEWVINRVCKQIGGLLHNHLRVSVNLSTKTLESKRLESVLLNATKRHEVDPQHIELEITEHSILKNEVATVENLKRLRKAGFRIAIDDFGVSHASFNYLRMLPVDKIKIDKVFIQNVTTGSKDYHIVTSLISLAQKLGILVTAEGVETEEQVELLKKINCDEVQGFYFSKPVPFDMINNIYDPIKTKLLALQH
ncbi:putative bifunctional diguanylate cyclase/phosphodiesterase [Alkalicoccobacillus porphyridii]|uniref:Bifunctional diguanylate cyclase/phosphodiesterase n=1 Tax=Alkalicoccobacillus porphyridii TaxID=2597270 RepID=A0A554A0I3_9BACI|nr:bifunctional diguanylate cyclase/phosphodiesterase [Alkalicoccobacillus porphyridii]TSB47195.1 bifunctional diguanylate cyclase/phosphodiesterase [Alkalicoccobacillus porphyridii]